MSYRQRAEEFMVKQLQRWGLTEEQAKGSMRTPQGLLLNLVKEYSYLAAC